MAIIVHFAIHEAIHLLRQMTAVTVEGVGAMCSNFPTCWDYGTISLSTQVWRNRNVLTTRNS
jgi:hypothetical protein